MVFYVCWMHDLTSETLSSLSNFKSVIDVVKFFDDEKINLQYLEQFRWKGEICCPRCGSVKIWPFSDKVRFKCGDCKGQFNAKTGTIFQGTQLSLQKWFVAFYLMYTSKGAISSYNLAEMIGCRQPTAWFVQQRLRYVYAFKHENEFRQLVGEVEVDETFIGGRNKNRHKDKKVDYKDKGRLFLDKTPVIGMIERGGRLVAHVIPSVEIENVIPAIEKNISKSATLLTDNWNGYISLDNTFNRYSVTHQKEQYVDGSIYTNTIENCWTHFKRTIKGSYITITPHHLNGYVQEFVFRFNHRNTAIKDVFNDFVDHINCRLRYQDLILRYATFNKLKIKDPEKEKNLRDSAGRSDKPRKIFGRILGWHPPPGDESG